MLRNIPVCLQRHHLPRVLVVAAAITGCQHQANDADAPSVTSESQESSAPHPLLEGFKRDEYFWIGKPKYAFWGNERLETTIALDSDGRVTEAQLQTLQALLDRQVDLRSYFAQQVFDQYQKNIYNTVVGWSEELGRYDSEHITPTLTNPSEIWKLLHSFGISIEVTQEAMPKVRFRIGCECLWDPSNGLGVEFENWKVVDFGYSSQ